MLHCKLLLYFRSRNASKLEPTCNQLIGSVTMRTNGWPTKRKIYPKSSNRIVSSGFTTTLLQSPYFNLQQHIALMLAIYGNWVDIYGCWEAIFFTLKHRLDSKALAKRLPDDVMFVKYFDWIETFRLPATNRNSHILPPSWSRCKIYMNYRKISQSIFLTDELFTSRLKNIHALINN